MPWTQRSSRQRMAGVQPRPMSIKYMSDKYNLDPRLRREHFALPHHAAAEAACKPMPPAQERSKPALVMLSRYLEAMGPARGYRTLEKSGIAACTCICTEPISYRSHRSPRPGKRSALDAPRQGHASRPPGCGSSTSSTHPKPTANRRSSRVEAGSNNTRGGGEAGVFLNLRANLCATTGR